MIGASIYGFVDYKQTSQKKEFSNMYVEEKENDPVVRTTDEKKEPQFINEVKTKKGKSVANKTVVPKEETIIPIKPIAEDDKVAVTERKEIAKTTSAINVSKDNNLDKKINKKKKLNTKLFSRGALEERFIEPKKAEKGNTDTKKKEDREN
jgi:hypothetical protein